MKFQKVLIAMMLSFILFGLSCATYAKYIVPILKDRPLRIDIETPRTVFRYHTLVRCGFLKLKWCKVYHLEYDFDLSKKEDRQKFNDLGFECSVPKAL